MEEGYYDVRLTVTNQYGSDSIFKTGTSTPAVTTEKTPASPTAVPVITAAAEVTNAAAKAPTPTKAPLSLAVTMAAALIGLAAVVVANRK